MKSRTFLTLTTVYLFGCGGSKDANNNVPEIEPPAEVLTNQLSINAIENLSGTFSSELGAMNSLKRVVKLTDNRLLVLGETSPVAINGNLVGYMAITDLEGMTYTYNKSDAGFADACVHSSGEYSIGQFKSVGSDEYIIEVKRYGVDSALVGSTILQALPTEPKYVIPADKTEWQQSPFTLEEAPEPDADGYYRQHSLNWGRFGLVKFYCQSENLYVSYNNGGQKIAKYSADLQLEWQKVMSIYYWGSSSRNDHAIALDFAENGDVYAVDGITTDAIPAYNHRFSTAHSLIEDRRQTDNHVLFKKLDAQGNLLEEKVFVGEHSQYAQDIAVTQDKVLVGTVSRIAKSGRSRYSTEWDIGLLAITTSDLSMNQHWIDIDKEDVLKGLTIEDEVLYLYGHTGGVQVDTNSWVADTSAFYATYNLDDKVLTPTVVKAKRSSEFEHLVKVDKQIIAVGSTNGPLTHSTDIKQQGLFVNKTNIVNP